MAHLVRAVPLCRRSVLPLAAAVFFAVAAPASAGLVTVENESEPGETPERFAFYGSGEEQNDVSVTTDGAEVLVTDSASPLTAGAPCVAETANRARCPMRAAGEDASGIDHFYVFLNHGDDKVDFTGYGELDGVGAIVEGYGGDDVILGTDEPDSLYGGSGRDRIEGRDGGDEIEGDGWFFEESEQPNPGKDSADVIDGGDGNDEITSGYTSGNGAQFGKGGDELRGGAGDDSVVGERMPKLIDGGPGKDSLSVGVPGSPGAKIVCGEEADLVYANPFDRISPDCERALVGDMLLTTAPLAFDASTGEISFRVRCLYPPCKGRLRLWASGRVAATANVDIRRRTRRKVQLTLAPGDAQRVAQSGRVFSFRFGGKYSAGFKMRLRAAES